MTPPTEAQEQTLDPIERLRVVAAIGGTVTLEAGTIRAVLVMINKADRFHDDGLAAYRRSIRSLGFSLALNAVSVLLCISAIFTFFGAAQ